MIKKLLLTKAKASLRYKGVGLSRKEKALFLKVNEITNVVNSLIKKNKKEVK